MRNYLILLLISFISIASAQSPLSSDENEGTFLRFQEEQYAVVIKNLEKKSNLSLSEEFLLNLSYLKGGVSNANNLTQLARKNPEHGMIDLVHFHLGVYFFYSGDSIKSRYHIAKAKPQGLSKKDQASYAFIAGVQSLESNNFKKAERLFAKAQELNFKNDFEVTYYKSFANYHLGNQSEALEGFNTALESDQFSSSSRFFIAKINMDLGKYDEVIALSKEELTDEKTITNSGFYQLIGEAYAKKNSLPKADAYFERAIQLHPEKPTPALYYQAGVSKFKIGNDAKAINYLTESGLGAGEYAQLSAFQLGRLYLQRREMENALTAYTEASASSDPFIKEESLYQVAKLHAELEEYTEAINYADDYLKLFNNGKWVKPIQNLIAETYLRTSNYDLAIEHLEKLGVIGETQQSIYQKVTFQKAQLLFNDALFDQSRQWFLKSIKYPMDAALTNESHFYIAESFMAQEQYRKAIQAYSRQSNPRSLTYYGIGYAYYNLNEYERAIEPFNRFIRNAPTDLKTDGQVRLADCYYATKNYNRALDIYASLNESNYVRYQIGLVQKELGEFETAISSLQKVERNTRWYDDAIYYIASMQFEKAQFSEAEKAYSRLIASDPSKDILSKSLLNRAICYSNTDQLKKAQNDYERILKNHLTSKEAFSAILGLQELQQKGITVKNLDGRISDYKKANPNDDSLESVEFEAAKSFYFDLNYVQAIQSLTSFIKEYPSSSFLPEAKYYIADAHYRNGDLDNALTVFNSLRTYQNTFTGRVFSRIGEINYQLGNYEDAIEAYDQLLILALTPKDTYNARFGKMKSYYDLKEYTNTIEVANEIIAADWKPLNAEPIATLYKGRSFMQLNNRSLAKVEFEKISSEKDVISAEANYQLAFIDFENGAYDASLEKLFQLNSKFGSYTQWVDQSYLLIAANYLATNQQFQAKATLRSIIEHSGNKEVVAEASARLKKIETQEVVSDSSKMNDN